MYWSKPLTILLSALLLSAAESAFAEEQTQAPIAPGQFTVEIKTYIDNMQKSIREEMQQTVNDAEARISDEQIQPLRSKYEEFDKSIKAHEEKHAWWKFLLTAIFGGLFASLFNYIANRRAAAKDRAINLREAEFAYNRLPKLRESLEKYLEERTDEFTTAKLIVDKVMESPLLVPIASRRSEGESLFYNPRPLLEQLEGWTVSISTQNFDVADQHHTKTLRNLLIEHEQQMNDLKIHYRDFRNLVAALSGGELAYDESILDPYGGTFGDDLRSSNSFLNDIHGAAVNVSNTVEKSKEYAKKIKEELDRLRDILNR